MRQILRISKGTPLDGDKMICTENLLGNDFSEDGDPLINGTIGRILKIVFRHPARNSKFIKNDIKKI